MDVRRGFGGLRRCPAGVWGSPWTSGGGPGGSVDVRRGSGGLRGRPAGVRGLRGPGAGGTPCGRYPVREDGYC